MRGQVKVYQKKIVARRRRRAFLISFYSVGGIALFISGLSFLSQLESISIDRVVVEGNSRVNTAAIENIVLRDVSGNYGYLFSKRNTFLYPKQEIEHDILTLPAIEEVLVSRRGLGVLVASVKERGARAQWCSDETHMCFSLDQDGFVYAPLDATCVDDSCAPSLSATFVYKGNISGDPVGQYFLPSNDFKKISFFIDQIKLLDIHPIDATISDTGYMYIGLEAGGKIIVNPRDDLTKVLSNLSVVLADKTIVPNLEQFLYNLEYLKLDAGNKVVYKLKP